jgi:hypothetical protein
MFPGVRGFNPAPIGPEKMGDHAFTILFRISNP